MANGWQTVSLGKILKRVERFEKKDDLQMYHFAGTYSFARGIFSGENKEGSAFRLDKIQRIHKGDFIYCKIMAWEGAFGIAPEHTHNCVMSGAFVVYEIDQSKIEPKFLEYYFKQEPVWKSIGSQSTGTNVRRRSLHPDQFEKATIPLPPLTEQRRIVARIEALAARVAAAQSLRREASDKTEALISAGTRRAFNSHSWKMVTIEELVGRENLKNGKSLKSDEQPSEVSCLRISALRNGKINCKDTKPISITIEDAKPYIIQKNDVYVVRGNGSKDLVGRAGLVERYKGVIIFPDLFIKVPLNTNQILPAFFVIWWNSPTMREKIVDLAKTTSGIWKINQGHIASCEIPVPPLEEQHRLVAYLDGLQAQVSALRAAQAETQKELDALMPSVLDKAFKGNL